MACVQLERLGDRSEILSLGVSSKNDRAPHAGASETGKRRHRRADVGPLGIIDEFDAVHREHALHAVGFAAIIGQHLEPCGKRAPRGNREGQSRQGIHGIVPPANLQGLFGHQQFHPGIGFAQEPVLALGAGGPGDPGKPHEAVALREAPLARRAGLALAERLGQALPCRLHGEAVLPIQDTNGLVRKNAHLGLGIAL